MKADSIDKIVGTYFAAITRQPIRYKGVTITPKPLVVGPLMLRGFTCPAGCGGCCPRFTLDYLPTERAPYPLTPRTVEIDNRTVTVHSDMQDDHTDSRCRNLRRDDGRCGIHGAQPFTCDFELLRFSDHGTEWRIAERLFGRGWAMKRTDGGVGAKCSITRPDPDGVRDVRRRLARLCEWADHFGIDHRGRMLVDYVDLFGHDPATAPRSRLDVYAR